MKKVIFFHVALWLIFIPPSGAAEFFLPFYGIVEYSGGSRVVSNDDQSDDVLLNEAAFRLGFARGSENISFNIQTDFTWDEVLDKAEITLREANITLFPSDWWELKVGRQILTWGTGERMFVNDLFPKDWKSYFIGRDDEYLNAPVTALKLGLFSGFGDIHAVVVPTFTPDSYVDGERLSYWSLNGLTGEERLVDTPDQTLADAEYHFRFAKKFIWLELALYSYKGFFKNPQGPEPAERKGIFPELAVYGFSVRTPVPGGTLNAESGYYDSIEDRNGTDPLIENSIVKGIVGFETGIVRDIQVQIQYLTEWMQNYEDYEKSVQSIDASVLKEEYRDRFSVELTHFRKQQTLTLSVLSCYSPAEQDGYLRPVITYTMSDHLRMTAGANIFYGEHEHTYFGQFQENTNLYVRVRYSY